MKGKNELKVILVAQNSSYTHTNAAVRILACALSPRHEAKIIETTVNAHAHAHGKALEFAETLYAEHADIYAFSVYIWNRREQLGAARIIKQLLPECAVVLGGPEVSYESEDFIEKNRFVDYLIRGEGEAAICDIADGKYPRGSIVDGGIYDLFEASSEPYYCNKYSSAQNYDGKLVYYESSRGCPYKCSYCLSSVKRPGEKVRSKPAELVEKEIGELMSHDIKAIKFVDRTFNFDRARTVRLFEYIMSSAEAKTQNGMYKGPMCHFEICAALLDDAVIEILSHAPRGLFRFEIGVQTVTPETLAAIGRKNDTEIILENVRRLREKTKVTVHLDLICGLPLDTVDGIKKSFDSIYGMCDLLQMGFLKLLPGTALRLREEAEKYGMVWLEEPPYTLLCNSTVTFAEMRRLSVIADTVEKFSEADGGFKNTVDFMTSRADSAFDFYDALGKYISGAGNISQRGLYKLLLDFGAEYFSLCGDGLQTLREYLRLDFIISNQGKPPIEIERKYTETEIRILSEIKRRVIRETPKNSGEWFVPALEVHLFSFDEENAYVFDRKSRRCETRPLS